MKSIADPQKCNYKQFKESIEEAGLNYTPRQIKIGLSKLRYDRFPDNGLDDEGTIKLLQILSEIDASEARLQKVEKKDLGSRVIKKKNIGVKPKLKKSIRNISDALPIIWIAVFVTGVFSFFTGISIIAMKGLEESGKYQRLQQKVYEIADVNKNNLVEYDEYLKLGNQLEKITGESYILASDSFEGVIEGIKYNMSYNPNRNEILKEFIEKYGDFEKPNL